mmetsp:Transcript_21568/g.29689  ORF Transcript_21568/g.29689 Transcript_21568/m.29689 type:complete len:109 (-) Transcript_21568:47-373(-)
MDRDKAEFAHSSTLTLYQNVKQHIAKELTRYKLCYLPMAKELEEKVADICLQFPVTKPQLFHTNAIRQERVQQMILVFYLAPTAQFLSVQNLLVEESVNGVLCYLPFL